MFNCPEVVKPYGFTTEIAAEDLAEEREKWSKGSAQMRCRGTTSTPYMYVTREGQGHV
jgi:hypothetical protein